MSAQWIAFPGKVPVCRDCGADWQPVRRGECSRCGSDAGPLSIPPGQSCDHDWSDRGSPGDYWQECWLCGVTRDLRLPPGQSPLDGDA